ncbi:translation initiation factor IF-2-like isoform X2 [Carcharodon carcharias]|uniref:translation initiation factor IF-2-like isoform X2 n=1 Tax=Carcharodon carcharias TaxID=13397 RepID=UPI001B7F1BDE|nr:translation initiation factor IF-2-like isoform X2 [Carcharodon carcharias]
MREEYGEEFMSMLQKLLWEYLQRLDQSLPRVRFDQLREAARAVDSSDPCHAQFLIGCLKKLDPRSLWLLIGNTEVSDPQDGVSLGLASEVEPDINLRGGPTFPTAWRSTGPRPPGEDGRSPWAPAGREEGGEGSGWVSPPFTPEQRAAGSRQPWARGPERRRSGRASHGGAGAPGRSCGGDPGCLPPRQSEPGDAGLRHSPHPLLLLLQPAAPVETSSAWREVKGAPLSSPSPACGRCGWISARKRAASGEGGLHGECSPGPGEPTRPWRLTGIKRASGRDVRGTRRDSDRSPWEGSSPSTSPSRRWRLPRRSKEKENQAASGLIHPACRSPDVGGSCERLQDPTTGIVPLRPHSVELTDVISDSEDEGRDPLTACLGGKRPTVS